eukprot:5501855-Alexandrium_andersonii.AAC.1
MGSNWGPAIAVHRRWVPRIKSWKSCGRVAMVKNRARQTWTFLSAHFPHSWRSGDDSREALWDDTLRAASQ